MNVIESGLSQLLLLKNVNKVGPKKKKLLLCIIKARVSNFEDLFSALQDVYSDRIRLRQELWRAKRDGLLSNYEGVYSLNPNAKWFCSFVSGEIRQAMEKSAYVQPELVPSPPPPGKNESVMPLIGMITHDHEEIDVQDRSLSNNDLTMILGSSTDRLQLTGSQQFYSDPTLDPMKTGPPPPQITGGRGSVSQSRLAKAIPQRFTPCTEQEIDSIMDAEIRWCQETNPPASVIQMVSKLLAHCFAKRSNQKFVSNSEEAAAFCGLSIEEFDRALTSLQGKVYYREYPHAKKLALYVEWLEMLKRGQY